MLKEEMQRVCALASIGEVWKQTQANDALCTDRDDARACMRRLRAQASTPFITRL